MLQLKHISKSYTTGDFTQQALDDVTISFRNNEFVAILGPSGSGKTTLLNIVGGLDHYDSGDLVIEGVSTKEYKDRDWDTYRNNRVGFVFQSYNLIPHQTVLANVELALTLSGVSGEERKRRAMEALESVGLGQHVNKKPAQLSGGQMQRVAIARALVNDPDIVLADEPTGALDSHTSVQIMDLLTEIARDRLVIMVTHNPELADTYATRIVSLTDGVIRSDSDPFDPTQEQVRESHFPPVRRTKMGFLTALLLSFNNLMTKKGRTIMTAFAGSIGIIGIASILALANGVNNYIKTVEEETLSVYPLQIMSTGFDMSSMMTMSGMGSVDDDGDSGGTGSEGDGKGAGEEREGDVEEATILTRMFTSITNNDLASLKEFFDEGGDGIGEYVSSIDYTYNVTPHIFIEDGANGYRQVNPDTTFASMGLGSGMSTSSLMSMSMSTDMFGEMMGNTDIVQGQYDVMAGDWPQAYDECVLVLSHNGRISDFLSYLLGLRDYGQLQEMVKSFVNDEEVEVEASGSSYSYEDLMGLEFKLVNSADFYSYDSEYGLWVDKTDDEAFMDELVRNGETLHISGIVKPREGVQAAALTSGIYYTPQLTYHLIDQAAETQVVKDQLADPSTDVFSGKPFGVEDDEEEGLDFGSMFTIDTDAISRAFNVDSSKLTVDMSGLTIDPSTLPQMPALEMGDLGEGLQPTIDQEKMRETLMKVMMEPDPDKKAQIFEEALPQIIDTSGMEEGIAAKVQQAVGQQMGAYIQELTAAISAQTQAAVGAAMAQMGANMAGAMSIDEQAFADAFQFNLTEEQVTELIMSMMGSQEATFDTNLAKLDYANLDKPYEIDIYPRDFESKQEVLAILDGYNQRMVDSGQEDHEVSYTDLVGTLMKSVTTIIDMISYVLIAFVAISLIVSSNMIGVITYISVLERKKEIGILRAIGASKGDISRVFNAETIIEGLVAGLLGVGITALCCIPASAIVFALFAVPNVAILPPAAAVILVLISVFLTFIAGLIPARSAAKKDPVEALRSE